MNAPQQHHNFFQETLASRDPEVFSSIRSELGRQRDEIELIASENIVSAAVMEAQGSIMTNKYAEGYSGRRYYGGVSSLILQKTLPSSARVNYSLAILPMSNPIRAAKPIKGFFRPF